MPAFVGNPISPHIAKLPDGSLLCRSVPLWRSGVQMYRAGELADFAGVLPDGVRADGMGMIKVHRPVDEVLSKMTLASAEGSPICDAHPPAFVSPSNWRTWASGHAQNIRPGPRTPDGDVTVVGDLVIRDTPLIEKIANGTREISAGYECRYEPADDGKSYVQRDLRINHIAILKRGRAGESVAIQDHAVQPYSIEDALSQLGKVFGIAWQRFPEMRPMIGEFFAELESVQTMDAAVNDAAEYASRMKKLWRA